EGDLNARVVFETLTDYGRRFAIAQRYIPDIATSGDSRVLLIDGEAVPYALARIPSAHDHRGNLAAGARGVGRPLNERDRWPACCTDWSFSGSPSAPARATGGALRDWKCCWCRTSFRRLTRTLERPTWRSARSWARATRATRWRPTTAPPPPPR